MVLNKNCNGKRINGYSNKEDADWAARGMLERIGQVFVSYYCNNCGMYHISPKSRQTNCELSATCTDSTGRPKNAYPTYDDAQRRAQVQLKEQGVKLTVYKCSTCGKYHLTSRSRRGKK